MNDTRLIENPQALDQYVDMMGAEGVEFVIDIIDSFLQDTPNNWRLLTKSMNEKDAMTFRRAAHTLKTGCATVGAMSLSEKFLTLEQAGKDNNILGAKSIMSNCKNELILLAKELQRKKSYLQKGF